MRIVKLPRLSKAGILSQLVYPVAAGLCLLTSPGSATAASWQAELANGQHLYVDPTTNRPIVELQDGEKRPLWDGVHQLSDGSTITIRSGIVVPNEEISTLRRAEPIEPKDAADEETGTAGSSAEVAESCDELVLKTCGLHQSCEDRESCQLSRQLRAMQFQASDQDKDNLAWTGQRCSEALSNDEEFPVCDQEPPLSAATCQKLADYVCGGAQHCAESPSCLQARGLLDLEQQAKETENAAELDRVQQQCHEVLVEQAFFPPCR